MRRLIRKLIHHVNLQSDFLIKFKSKHNQMKKIFNLLSQRVKDKVGTIMEKNYKLSKKMLKKCMGLCLEVILRAAIGSLLIFNMEA